MAGRSRIAWLVGASALVFAGVAAAADTWPKHKPNAADQALAKKSVLHLSDFVPGSGWKVAPADSSSGGDDKIPACDGPGALSDVGRVVTGSASTSFKAPGLQVWSEADVMQTVAMVRRDQKTSNAVLMKCIRAAFNHDRPAGLRLVSVTLLSFPQTGDWSRAYRVLTDLTANGTTVRVQIDLVFVLKNRLEISLMQVAPYSISAAATAAEVRMVQRLAGTSSLVA